MLIIWQLLFQIIFTKHYKNQKCIFYVEITIPSDVTYQQCTQVGSFPVDLPQFCREIAQRLCNPLTSPFLGIQNPRCQSRWRFVVPSVVITDGLLKLLLLPCSLTCFFLPQEVSVWYSLPTEYCASYYGKSMEFTHVECCDMTKMYRQMLGLSFSSLR